MTKRNSPTIRIHVRRIVGNFQIAQHCERLRSKCLVQFDYIHVADRELCQRQHLAHAVTGPIPMILGATPAAAVPRMRAFGFRP